MDTNDLYNYACDAADRLMGDTSISKEMTVEALECLRDHVQSLIDAVKCDL
jgi:hypothetical protein